MADLKIRQGELLSPVQEDLLSPSDPDLDLTGKAVRFVMRLATSTAYKVDAPATVVDANTVRYDWQAGDTDTPGIYTYRWVVDEGGLPHSYPTRERALEVVGFETVEDGLPWATATEAQRYTADADGAEPLLLQMVLEDAADLVAGMVAQPASPTPQAFVRKAKRAELRVFDYLWTTGGYKTNTSAGVGDLRFGDSYGNLDVVKGIVTATMGSYAAGSDGGFTGTLEVSSTFPAV